MDCHHVRALVFFLLTCLGVYPAVRKSSIGAEADYEAPHTDAGTSL